MTMADQPTRPLPDHRTRCACGAEVIEVINAEFPGMSLVLEPEPADMGGVYRVARYSVSGQMFGKRSTESGVPKHNPHRFACPLDQPRRREASDGRYVCPCEEDPPEALRDSNELCDDAAYPPRGIRICRRHGTDPCHDDAWHHHAPEAVR